MKHHGLKVRGQPQEWAGTWTSCFSLPVIGLASVGRQRSVSAAQLPQKLHPYIHSVSKFLAAERFFYLTIEVGELDTRTVYHI